jgi:hypothetical protein
MSDAYRDEHEAALRQLDALRRENDELRAQLLQGGPREQDLPPRAGPSGLLLIAGVFFLAGSITVAGAQRSQCARRAQDAAASPCPYLLANAREASQEGPFARGARLLRAEPGVIRVELQGPPASAHVRVDGLSLPRSGSVALSGPLAGGSLHVVDVEADGFAPLRTRVWVAPGRTERVRVALAPDPLAQTRDPRESLALDPLSPDSDGPSAGLR